MSEPVQPAFPGVDASANATTRVAIVAVHGVGHHGTGASADAMANLLSGLEGYSAPPGSAPFNAFVTNPIQFPLPGAMFFPSMQPEKTPDERARGMFEERRGFFAGKFSWKNWRTRRQEVCNADMADEFMRMQLADYTGDAVENTLQTDRLEGRRAATAARPAADVNIYDMQWADAASGDSSFVRFFMSFYQLLIHLISLARIAVDMAALEQYGAWDWFLLQRAHNYAARMFTLVILPALTLLMGVAFSTLPLLLGTGRLAMVVASAVFFVGVLGLIALVSQRLPPPFGSRGWWPWLFSAAGASVAVSFFVFSSLPALVGLILVLEWWVLGAGVLSWVFLKYDEVRPGAFAAGITAIIVSTAGFLVCVRFQRSLDPVALRTASFWTIQYIFLALRISWVIFIALMIVSLVFEWICRARIRFAKRREVGELARARTALRTGRFAMALPAVLSLLLSVFVWSGVYHFIVPRVQLFEGVVPAAAPVCSGLQGWVLDPRATESLFVALEIPGQKPAENPYHFLEGLLVQSAPPGFTIVLGLMAVGFSLLILMVLPAVFFEFRTPFRALNAPAKRLRTLGLQRLPLFSHHDLVLLAVGIRRLRNLRRCPVARRPFSLRPTRAHPVGDSVRILGHEIHRQSALDVWCIDRRLRGVDSRTPGEIHELRPGCHLGCGHLPPHHSERGCPACENRGTLRGVAALPSHVSRARWTRDTIALSSWPTAWAP